MKHKSDYELGNIGKASEKRSKFDLILTLVKKTFSSSMLRLLKYKTVEENWIEKSLAPFDARN